MTNTKSDEYENCQIQKSTNIKYYLNTCIINRILCRMARVKCNQIKCMKIVSYGRTHRDIGY